ncbi:MAG: peptidylprolyl isomerase [Ktedonobacteraceae bacterium]
MPKTSKRAATKRAARIAKLHATELPKLQVKEIEPRQRPGYKKPARGIARYPWATVLIVLIIGLSIFILNFYHVGPFAPKPIVSPTPTPVAASPCLKIVNQLTDTAPAPTAAQFKAIVHTYAKAPAMTINTSKIYCGGINTNRGLIVVELDPKIAPITVNNFVFLAQNHFYDGLKFHRVVPGFVAQTGDPLGTGAGGPGYKFNDEPVKGQYTEGCLAMANSGVNTNGSQFFICTANDTKTLQPLYNLFGHVVQGMNVALQIQGPNPSGTAAQQKITPDVINHLVVAVAP